MKVCNKLGQRISYDRLHRQLTSKANDITEQVENTGVLIPEDVSEQETPHIFAIDNLYWKKRTLKGGTFYATKSIVLQNNICQQMQQGVTVP